MSLEKKFSDFVKLCEDKKLFIEGVAVADETKLLCEHHFRDDVARNIYSHTKSFTSTAVGLAADAGKLSLDDKLIDYFPESVPENPAADLDKITLRHLLTMSSGFNHSYLMAAERRTGQGYPDYVKYMLSRPMEKKPGERFCYSNGDTYLAGRMAEKALGITLENILYQHLFSKMGIGWPAWEHDPMGHAFGASGLYLRLSDMIKLGQLYLAGGMWNGERILSDAWTKAAGAKQIETNGNDVCNWNDGYGYQFWISPFPGAYRADGAYGQITTILPEKDLTVAVQCPDIGKLDDVKIALTEFMNDL
ncbi:MAG: serine hydrolase [Clostridia bacterium]|nr:serine hydrolase [Clostridia bacterium]